MTNRAKPWVRLATENGRHVDESRDRPTALDGYVGEPKLSAAQRFDLPGPPLGDFLVPHTHSLTADTKSIGKRLVRPAEVVKNFLESSHARSVSMLPQSVKPLTLRRKRHPSKLIYMGKKRVPKDDWAIERGAAMKAARLALGQSQSRIATLAGVNDRETIAQYESGLIENIDPKTIPKLAMALGMHPQQLSRTQWKAKDEASDLRVSSVARQIAYNFDDYPLILQNHIRQTIARYEELVSLHGKEAADAMLTPSAGQAIPHLPPPKRSRSSH